MTVERSIRLLAGVMVLISLAMGYFVSPYWLLLTAFVGVNLVQSSLTGFCPPETVIKRLFFSGGSKTATETR
jgi:glucan phosphoethanolaminetransferase (alkaline phosphatase superfamily)